MLQQFQIGCSLYKIIINIVYMTSCIKFVHGFFFIIDLQCLQAVVESQTKTLHPKCHEMLVQRMEMFKNAKALVRNLFVFLYSYCNI